MPAIRGPKSKSKTRRRRRDLDQVHADLHDPKHLKQYQDTKSVEDVPALGQYYCIECAKWFEAEHNLVEHRRGKPHKRRVRQLKEDPYTQREAEAAAGMVVDTDQPQAMAVDSPNVPTQAHAEPVPDQKNLDDNDDEEYDAFFAAY